MIIIEWNSDNSYQSLIDADMEIKPEQIRKNFSWPIPGTGAPQVVWDSGCLRLDRHGGTVQQWPWEHLLPAVFWTNWEVKGLLRDIGELRLERKQARG